MSLPRGPGLLQPSQILNSPLPSASPSRCTTAALPALLSTRFAASLPSSSTQMTSPPTLPPPPPIPRFLLPMPPPIVSGPSPTAPPPPHPHPSRRASSPPLPPPISRLLVSPLAPSQSIAASGLPTFGLALRRAIAASSSPLPRRASPSHPHPSNCASSPPLSLLISHASRFLLSPLSLATASGLHHLLCYLLHPLFAPITSSPPLAAPPLSDAHYRLCADSPLPCSTTLVHLPRRHLH